MIHCTMGKLTQNHEYIMLNNITNKYTFADYGGMGNAS